MTFRDLHTWNILLKSNLCVWYYYLLFIKKNKRVFLAKQSPEVMELINTKLSGRNNSQVHSTPCNLHSHHLSEEEYSSTFTKSKDFVLVHSLR